MKAVCVLLVLALALFARAEEQAVGADVAAVVAEQEGAMEMMPQVDMDLEETEDEDEADIEDEESDEEEAEDEEESDEEAEEEADEEADEMAFLEADAEDNKPKSPATIVAPKPIKAKPFKFHTERVVAQVGKYDDPEMAKLDLALAAVKEDILSTNKQITDERKWVIAVAKIIASYNDKMKRVEAHIIALRKEMKSLYRKKKQIENLKLQRALEAKLKEAKNELATLTSSLQHVSVKQGELNRSGSDLRLTIAGIQAQLAKLRGQQLRKPRPAPRKCGKGKRYSRKAKKCVARSKKNSKKAKKAKKAKKF
jgi:hypothetical protein